MAKSWNVPMHHNLDEGAGIECLHPLCDACAKQAIYTQLKRIAEALERLAGAAPSA